jgi:hypothetical protein
MGVVFSPEAIRSGRVPVEGAHELAAQEAMQFLLGEGDSFNELAHSFLIYGSVASGTATIRSDLDLFVAPYRTHAGTPNVPEGPGATLKRRLLDKYSVPLETHVVPAGSFWPEDHSIDPLLVDHLLEAQENPLYSYNWPINRYRDQDSSHLDTNQITTLVHRYASRKLGYFADAEFHCTGVPDLKVFQRALELPKAIGRKLFRLHRDEDVHIHTPAEAFGQFAMRIATRTSLYEDYYMARNALENPEPEKSALSYMSDAQYQQSFDLHINRNHEVEAVIKLGKMDDEYNLVLQDALETGRAEPYKNWLQANYLTALHLGQTVSSACLSYYSPRRGTALGSFPQTLSEFRAEVETRISIDAIWEY